MSQTRVSSTSIFPILPKSTGTPRSTPASYYRGGTSRALIFNREDLPATEAERRQLFLQGIGAPDKYGRQLNGLGAGISSLSKVCIIGRGNKSLGPDPDEVRERAKGKGHQYDVTYEFVAIGVERDEVDYAGNCGNMASAIGPWALEHGLIDAPKSGEQSYMTVDFINTNTSRMLQATFPLDRRTDPPKPLIAPETGVPGVSGLGVPVLLSFFHPSGSKTSGLLPTGNARDEILGHQVTMVDAGNPCVFVRASDFPSIKATILPNELLTKDNAHILAKLDAIRRQAAVSMGICKTEAEVPRVVPKVAMVAPPQRQFSLSGETSEDMDLVVRFISDMQPHRAIPLTGAVCTSAAAGVRGGIVEECLGSNVRDFDGDGVYDVRIAQPSGVMSAKVTWRDGDVEMVGVVRSTRRIMEGEVYWVDEDK